MAYDGKRMDQIALYQVLANDGNKAPFARQTVPGRWSSGRLPAVYASCDAATALLEYLAHLESSPPESLSCSRLVLEPGQLEFLDQLPEDWRERPYRAEIQRIGDAWLESRRSVALRVPSVVAPASFNVVLNPEHPDFPGLTPDLTEMFRLDSRLN